MLWWRRKPRYIPDRPEEYRRPKGLLPAGPAGRPPSLEIAAVDRALEAEQTTGPSVRGAWGITAALAGAMLVLVLAGLVIFITTQAGSSWRAWRAAPLHRAAAAGNLDEVRRLIARGADPDGAGEGRTPLLAALQAGHSDVVEALLRAGATPGREAVDTALRYQRRADLLALIEAGADPDTRTRWTTQSLLEIATENNDPELVRLLLDCGADPDAAPGESPFSMPALHIAALNNRVEIAQALLDHGADPTLTRDGWSALDLALQRGHGELAQILRKAVEARYEAGQPR